MKRRYKRGPYMKHGLTCPFRATGRLRRRGAELPQPDGILLSLGRCTLLFMAALFILGVIAGCAGGSDREEPSMTFCVEVTARDYGTGWMDTIASDVRKRFPALAERWLGRKARLSDCASADIVFEIGPETCSATCPHPGSYYNEVSTPLPCWTSKGREAYFDGKLTAAAAICYNKNSVVPSGIDEEYPF